MELAGLALDVHFVEVIDRNIGQRINVGAGRGHGGSEYSGDHHANKTNRHMIDDEVWKDVSILGQGREIAGKESEQHNPEEEKEEKLWNDNDATADNGAAAFFLAPTR